MFCGSLIFIIIGIGMEFPHFENKNVVIKLDKKLSNKKKYRYII